MKSSLLSILLVTLCFVINAQTKADKISELMQAYASQNSYNGAILVTEKGQTLLHKGYGYKNAAAGALNDTNTIFQLGSVTKQFTAAVILKLAAQKKLKLTDKLSKYYPGYPKGDSITIHHLLSHTSGIVNYTNNEAFMSKEVLQPVTEQRMLSIFKNEPLEFSPGTRWGYSNSGYMLLGYIIKKVTKQPYEKVVRQLILSPLKMEHSGFDFVRLKSADRAKGYFVMDGAKSIESSYVDSSASYAAGAMYSTTADMLKWHNGLLQNKILSRQWLEKAFTPVKNKYGYGWAIDSADGKRITTHNGGIFGFNSSFYRVEADDVCIVMLNNAGNPKLDEIAGSVLKILYNKPYKLPEAKKEITLSQEMLKRYEGLYEVVPQFQITITVEEGKLIAQATNQPKFELFAQKENYFFLKAVEAEVEFVTNEKKEVEKLILYQGGRKTDAKKIK
jgi:CubicO group peptidase (beta-lactamase class C family)